MVYIPLKSPKTGTEIRVYYSEELKVELKKLEDERVCIHSDISAVNQRFSDGKLHSRKVCLSCGKSFGGIPKDEKLQVFDVAALRDTIEDDYQERRFQIGKSYSEADQKFSSEWKRRYQVYLTSEPWRTRRKAVLNRANNICEGCMEQPAIQVHHLTYERAFDELLFDLVAVCRDCHKACHPEHNPDFYSNFDDLPFLSVAS